MNGLSHKQARRYMLADQDGLLSDAERLDLETHLSGCEACRAESDSLSTLTSRLQSEFHERWDAQGGPSQHVMENVRSQMRRIIMSNKVRFGLGTLAGFAALIVLGFGLNFVISQLRDHSNAASEIAVPDNHMPVSSVNAKDRLLAFEKMENGNYDIFTIHPDGSGLTNITNNPASDSNPIWSPDGKHIAFTSNRISDFGSQIFLMDPDGANVTQLTIDKGDHILPLATSGLSDLWSPDGSKLLYLVLPSQFDTEWVLQSIDVNNGDVTSLDMGRFDIGNVSWSPDGKYIGYTKNDPQNTNENFYIPDLYVADADGSNLREIKKLIPQDGYLYTYQWSSKEGTIIFMGYKDHPFFIEAIYEFNLITNSLTQKSTLDSRTIDWHDDISLVMPENPETTFIWQRPDGTSKTLNWSVACWEFNFERSLKGNFAIGAYCPDNKSGFYWANSDGSTIKNLLGPLSDDIAGSFRDVSFSPDDQYITTTIATSRNTNIFIINVEESLKDPSNQPVKILIGEGDLPTIPSWQPVVSDETIEEKEETVEEKPVQPSTYNGLIAFTSAAEDGNLDIFTMHADGSKLTNLTNNPAQDVSPSWSPDGKRIAFESDRNGFRQIFLMDADGSNLVLLNESEEKADQWIGEPYDLGLNIWSPDGNKLVFYEVAPGDENGMLYVIDANGENKKSLVEEKGKYTSPSWSPDGKHIAFITTENNMARIYITDANGDNLTNVTKTLPSDETLYPRRYSWSRDGQSISFVASNWNYLLGRGNEGTSTYQWTAYTASLDGNTLIVNASADSQMGGYWDGTYFISGSAAVSSSPEYTWVRSDGTSTTVNPIENCERVLDDNTGDYITGYSSYKQSPNGNVVIGAYCPNGEKWLFLANSKGIFIPLLNSPIHVQSIPSNAMRLWAPPDFIWSSDDQHIAFNIFSSGKTDMYILNVNDALQNPSAQPFHMTIGNDTLYYSPVWQPMP